MRFSSVEADSHIAAAASGIPELRSATFSSASAYSASATRPVDKTRVSQSTSIAKRNRRHCHHRGRFHGSSTTATVPARSSSGSRARTCWPSWASVSRLTCSSARSNHCGTTIRGCQKPSTAGPISSETSTSTPSSARRDHEADLRRMRSQERASPPISSAEPQNHRMPRSDATPCEVAIRYARCSSFVIGAGVSSTPAVAGGTASATAADLM